MTIVPENSIRNILQIYGQIFAQIGHFLDILDASLQYIEVYDTAAVAADFFGSIVSICSLASLTSLTN